MKHERFQALVLNADFRPICTSPLSVMCWQDAVRASMSGHFVVLGEHDEYVHSPSMKIRIPSVLAVKKYVDLRKPAALTRWNLFLAHRFRCAYCGGHFASSELSFEHVMPASRGGRTTWENLVPACMPCNGRKGNRTPAEAHMHLLRKPYHPTRLELNTIGADFVDIEAAVTQPWLSYLYWGAELEP